MRLVGHAHTGEKHIKLDCLFLINIKEKVIIKCNYLIISDAFNFSNIFTCSDNQTKFENDI